MNSEFLDLLLKILATVVGGVILFFITQKLRQRRSRSSNENLERMLGIWRGDAVQKIGPKSTHDKIVPLKLPLELELEAGSTNSQLTGTAIFIYLV